MEGAAAVFAWSRLSLPPAGISICKPFVKSTRCPTMEKTGMQRNTSFRLGEITDCNGGPGIEVWYRSQ
jgi:hypothetical protein